MSVLKLEKSDKRTDRLFSSILDRQGHEWGRDEILHEDEVNPGHDSEAGISPVQAEDLRRLGHSRISNAQNGELCQVSK